MRSFNPFRAWFRLTALLMSTFLLTVMPRSGFGQSMIKEPNVSGQFYPADPAELARDVDRFLADADIKPSSKHICIVVAPHAGYVYSGQVAAYGYKAAGRYPYKTIVILAPSHFLDFDGISV